MQISRESLSQLLLEKYNIAAEPAQFSPWALHLEKRVDFAKWPAFRNGLFEVQDEGSQLIALLTQAQPGETVIDYCAGAGGKTLAMAAMMQNQGQIYACDVSQKRLYELRNRAFRNQVEIVQAVNLRENFSLPSADCVLVDAPCSGLGTQRRKPETRWWLDEETLAKFVERQQRILELSSLLVNIGGRLIYATCSILEDENEHVIHHFLERHRNWELLPASSILPFIESEFFKLLPHQYNSDGFFAAVLQKIDAPTPT